MNKVLSFLSLAFLLLYYSYSIAQGATCGAANQICGTTPPFPANTTGGTAVGSVGSVGCLSTTPNESWFFFEVAVAGPVSGSITNSNNVDVDGAIFGPFSSTTAACAGLTAGNIVACDYTASATVPFSFNAVPGIYMVLITNFSGSATTIDLSFTAASNALIDCIAESADYSICEGDPAQAMSATVLSSTGLCPPATTTVTCTTNTPATTGSYTTNVSTSVNASCNISGVPAGATVTNVSYSINGGAVNGSWCQELRVNVDGPGTTYDITGGALVGATGTCTLAGLSAIGGWSGTSTNSPNGTYTFSFYETFNDAGTSQDFSVTQIQVVITYAIPGSEPQLTWFNTQTGGTAIGTGSPFQPIGAAGSDVPNTSTAGVYDFWVGCGNDGIRSQVQVFIHDVPTITSTSVVCAGSTFTATINAPAISASPTGCSWQYSFNNGATWGTSNTLTGIAPGSANLTVLVRNSCRNQCISAAATIVIPSAIIPTFNPVGPYCAGSTIPALPTSSTNSPAITGTWSPAINNTTTTTYTFTPATNQCATTTTLTITINPLPTVTVNSSTVCAGVAATVTATPGVTGTYSYAWTVPSGATAPGNVASFTTTIAGTYSVIITNTTTGCASLSASGTVTVNPLPTVTANSPTVCAGASVTLTGGGANTYTWTGGVTNGTAFVPASSGTYTVTGTSLAGCINTAISTVTVNPLPVVNAPDATVCVGGSVTLTASGASTYTWTPATYLNTTTGASVVSTPPSNITYTVTGTDVNGCISSDAVTVTVSGNAPINAGLDVAICIGQSTTITATGGVTYNWDNGLGAGASHTVSPTATTTYIVTGTDANGCLGTDAVVVTVNPLPTVTLNSPTVCAGTNATLTATPGTAGTYNYTWIVPGGATNPGNVSTFTTTVAGSYSVVITNTVTGCVSASASGTVTVNPLPTATVNSPTVCAGTPATVTAAPGVAGTYSYAWTVPGGATNPGNVTSFTTNTAGTYSVILTNTSTGCVSVSASGTVTINPLPTVTVNSPTVCAGTPATVTATPGTAGTYDYAWTVPAGATAPGNVATFTTTIAGTYSVIITDPVTNCVSTSASGAVTVNPLPTVTVNSPTICSGATATVTATPGSAGTYSYAWTVPGGFTNPGSVASFTTTTAGTYTVIITNTTTGCVSTSASGTVTVNPLPTATVNNPSVCAGTPATVTASPGEAGTYTYAWTVPGGVTNPGNVASFTTSTAGTYSVVLTNSTTGCVSLVASGVVSVSPLPTVTVNSPTVCAGTPATVTATPGTTGTYNYAWTVPAGATAPGNVATFTTTIEGTYSVIITDPVTTCVSLSASGAVTVNPLPTVTVNSPTVCAGSPAVVTATPGTAGTYSYAWTVPGGASNPGNVASFTATVSGTYSVVITNTTTSCVSASASGIVTINPLPTATVNSPTVCAGTPANVTATPGVPGTYNYTWTVPGGASNPGNASSFTATVSGTYSVILTDPVTGCVSTSAAGVVTINPIPVITLTPTDPTTCNGTDGSVLVSGTGTGTVAWTGTASGSTASAVLPYTINGLSSGSYNVTFTNAATGCVSTTVSTTLNNPGAPVINTMPNLVTCGTPIQILESTITGTNLTSNIGFYNSPNGVGPIADGTTYNSPTPTTTVYVYDANGVCTAEVSFTVTVNPIPTVTVNSPTVCAGAAATVTATPGTAGTYSYAWTVPAGATNPGDVVSFNTTISGTYSVIITNTATGCVSASASGIVTVNPLPTVTVDNPTICAGETATVTATPGSAGTYSYAWTVPAGAGAPGNVASFTTTIAGTYSVIITNTTTTCVSASASGIVTVNPLPTATVNSPTVCAGAPATVTASPGVAGSYSFAWTVPAGASAPGNVATFTTTTAGTYSVILTDVATGCVSASASGAVSLNALPTVTVNSPTVCTGFAAAVTATPGTPATYSYVWTVPAGALAPGNVATFNSTIAGTYSVIITNTTTGCVSASASGIVSLDPLPTVTVNSPTVCFGNSATVTATPGTAGTYSYAWTVPAGAGAPGNVATFNTTTAGTYSVIITNTTTTCVSSSASGTVTINPLPTATVNSPTVCAGAPATVTASPGVAGSYSFVWSVPAGATDPGNVSTFTTTTAGTYSVVLTNTVTGCVSTSASGTVTVNTNPTVTVNNPTVCAGTPAAVSATPGTAGTYSYTWTVAAGATAPGNVANFSTSIAGTYSVIITNTTTTCVSPSASGTVTINPNPTVTVNSSTVCAGSPATVTATPGTAGVYDYAWVVPAGATPPGNVATFTTTIAGTYSVVITNTATGCFSTSASGTVTVNPLPTATIAGTVTLCQNEPQPIVTFTGANGTAPYTFTYNLNNGTNQTVTSTGSTATISVPTTTAGTFNYNLVSVQDASSTACSQAQTGVATITVNPLPTATVTGTAQVCEGGASQTVTFTGANGTAPYIFTYNLNNGPAQTITSTGNSATITVPSSTPGVFNYILMNVEDASATTCSQNQTGMATITINALPNVFAGNDISVCDGESVVLTGSGAATYSWNNGVVNGSPFVPTLGTTTYTVVGTSATGCINSDQVNVTVNPIPDVSFVPGAANGCTPFTTTLTNTTADVSNCVWTISNGTVITGCGTVPVTFTQGGCYDVTLTTTSANGCSSTFTANNLICVEDNPDAAFSPSSNQLSTLNTEVFFQNNTTGANQYAWTFGVSDFVSTETNPTYTYPNNGEGQYVVTLVATSPLGCTDTATTIIQVYEELLFYVPNTFTPDNDNYNPVFLPIFTSGFDPYDYNLMIFNRWGEVIFESNNHEVGWDGSYGKNGEIEMVQDGVYTWKIEFKVTRWDERRRAVGHVNLIR
jgi:gliding motility-associated-like protein